MYRARSSILLSLFLNQNSRNLTDVRLVVDTTNLKKIQLDMYCAC